MGLSWETLGNLLLHWLALALALWLVSRLLRGVRFDSVKALLAAALVLGLVNAYVRPLLWLLTLPFTLLTLGLFLLVINALMLLLTASLVPGFRLSGFWTAMLASVLVSLFSLLLDHFFQPGASAALPGHLPPMDATWI